MSARASAAEWGVVDDRDEAFEGVADGVGGGDEFSHVFVVVLATVEGAVEGVDDDGGGVGVLELAADGGDEGGALFDEVKTHVDQPERHRVGILGEEFLPERHDAFGEATATFEGAIDDGSLDDVVAAIWPAERDVHHHIKEPEAFSALFGAEDDGESDIG